MDRTLIQKIMKNQTYNGKVITNDEDKEIPDTVNTLILTIAQHFIGDPSLWKDRSAEPRDQWRGIKRTNRK